MLVGQCCPELRGVLFAALPVVGQDRHALRVEGDVAALVGLGVGLPQLTVVAFADPAADHQLPPAPGRQALVHAAFGVVDLQVAPPQRAQLVAAGAGGHRQPHERAEPKPPAFAQQPCGLIRRGGLRVRWRRGRRAGPPGRVGLHPVPVDRALKAPLIR